MSQAPIYFAFADAGAASLALDTLNELGYHAHETEHEGKPAIQLYIDHNDLTSALEITQASGGVLLEESAMGARADSYTTAYGIDTVPIPAHMVNEDWSESYYTSDASGLPGPAPAASANTGEAESFDPSGDDYDHFSAGVRL